MLTPVAARPDARRWRHVDSAEGVGRRLREARVAAKLSQRELSFPGCTAVYICRIERGERVPSLQVLRELAERLNIAAEWLAEGEGSMLPRIVIPLDTGRIDEQMRNWTRGTEAGEIGLSDLTEEEAGKLLGELRSAAESTAGPVALAIVTFREYPVGTA